MRPLTAEERATLEREYDRIGSALAENESAGEGRVSLYLGLWTAAVAAVATLVGTPALATPGVKLLGTGGLVALAVIGVVTLARILKRNWHTDELIDALGRLRTLLLGNSPESLELVGVATPWKVAAGVKPCRSAWLHVGLLHVLYLANSVIPALVGFLYVADAYVLHGSIFLAAYVLQVEAVVWLNRRRHEERTERLVEFQRVARIGVAPPAD